MQRPADPGAARVSAIAVHWQVTAPTARRILEQAGLTPVGTGWPKYRWADIWRLEGAGYVPACDHPAFKAPLLKPGDLPARDPEGRKARTLRRYLMSGQLPAIRLSTGIIRIRACEVERAIGYV